MNRLIQFQNGQSFNKFKVNAHPAGTDDWELKRPGVTVQLFKGMTPTGYVILDPQMTFDLARELEEAAIAATGE